MHYLSRLGMLDLCGPVLEYFLCVVSSLVRPLFSPHSSPIRPLFVPYSSAIRPLFVPYSSPIRLLFVPLGQPPEKGTNSEWVPEKA